MDRDTIEVLKNMAFELDDAIATVTSELSKLDVSDIQQRTALNLEDKLYSAAGQLWDLLDSLEDSSIPDDYPLTIA